MPTPNTQTPPTIDWNARAEEVRRLEWDQADELIATGQLLLRHLRLHPERAKASITSQAVQLFQLADQLRRQATGLDQKKKDPGPTGPPPLTPEEQADIDRFYGPSAPAAPAPAPAPSPTPAPPANGAPSASPAASTTPTPSPQPATPAPSAAPAPAPQTSTCDSGAQRNPDSSPQPPAAPNPAQAEPGPNPQSPPQDTSEPTGAFSFVSQPLSIVLDLYQQLSETEVDIDSSVRHLPLFTITSGPSVTRTEALRLIESALYTQAGLQLIRLDPTHVRLTREPQTQ